MNKVIEISKCYLQFILYIKHTFATEIATSTTSTLILFDSELRTSLIIQVDS